MNTARERKLRRKEKIQLRADRNAGKAFLSRFRQNTRDAAVEAAPSILSITIVVNQKFVEEFCDEKSRFFGSVWQICLMDDRFCLTNFRLRIPGIFS